MLRERTFSSHFFPGILPCLLKELNIIFWYEVGAQWGGHVSDSLTKLITAKMPSCKSLGPQIREYGRRADAFKWCFTSKSTGPWWQDVQWREMEELRMAPEPLAWKSEWMVALFSVTGNTGGESGVGLMIMMSIWDVFGTTSKDVLCTNGCLGQMAPWKRSCQGIWHRVWVLDVRRLMDCWYRKEPNGTGSLSWLCCSVGNLCCYLCISASLGDNEWPLACEYRRQLPRVSWMTRTLLSARPPIGC